MSNLRPLNDAETERQIQQYVGPILSPVTHELSPWKVIICAIDKVLHVFAIM